MKRLSIVLGVAVAATFLFSCKGDLLGGGCSMEGNWKISSVDMSSKMLDSSTLAMSKEIALARTYQFTADSVTIIDGSGASYMGTYAVNGDFLKIEGNSGSGQMKENMKIVSCQGELVTLSSRVPADTTKEAIVVSTFVLQKAKKQG